MKLACHGIDGVGENYSQQALTDKNYFMAPALDASAHAWHHSDAGLVKSIREGSPRTKRMAAWRHGKKLASAPRMPPTWWPISRACGPSASSTVRVQNACNACSNGYRGGYRFSELRVKYVLQD